MMTLSTFFSAYPSSSAPKMLPPVPTRLQVSRTIRGGPNFGSTTHQSTTSRTMNCAPAMATSDQNPQPRSP